MVRTRLFVVASPAGRKKPPHAVGRWPSASDGRWGFARFPQHARLRVSCGPGMPGPYGRWPGVELLPGRADMESAPTEGIGRKGNNNEVPRASNAHPTRRQTKFVPYSLQYTSIAFAANSAVPGPPAALMLAVNSPPAPYIWPSWAKISFVQV